MRKPYNVTLTKSVTELQDSYDALMPSDSKDPLHLIGYQEDPQLQQQQQQKQQKAMWKAAQAPIDMRDVLKQKEQQNRLEQIVQKKIARELTKSDAQSTSPTPSPTQQPEGRRVRISKELLSQTEARQYDITAKDAVPQQRDPHSGISDSETNRQKFEIATSQGEPQNVRTLEKPLLGCTTSARYGNQCTYPTAFPLV